MTCQFINHSTIGLGRVATQYKESTRFLAWLRALLQPGDEIEACLQHLTLQSDIDLAEGINLDVIGEIVGVSRIIPHSIPLQFFGFDGQPGALPFGEAKNIGIGGRFRDEQESESGSSVLADPEYRMLIRAQIIKNHSRGTNEDILNGLIYLFGSNEKPVPVCVEDVGGMAIQVGIGRHLTFLEKILVLNLDILPRPAGVRITQRVYNAPDYFGFDGQPGALPFGEENLPEIGGQFAEEF